MAGRKNNRRQQDPGPSQDPAPGPLPVTPGPVPNFKLADYWGNRPTLWFAQAEGNFELYGETSSRRKFFRVLNALPEDITRQVADLIEQVPDDNPYELLKGRLLGAAKVSDFQRAEKLMALPALGDRKPSDLLATMLEVCPRGWEKENFFTFLFMSRLPLNVRVLLKGVPTTDLQLLAEAADEASALHSPAGNYVNNVNAGQNVHVVAQEQENLVAALKSAGFRQGKGKQGNFRKKDSTKMPTVPEESELASSKVARQAAGVCLNHWRYGKNCHVGKCRQPCSFQGN